MCVLISCSRSFTFLLVSLSLSHSFPFGYFFLILQRRILKLSASDRTAKKGYSQLYNSIQAAAAVVVVFR